METEPVFSGHNSLWHLALLQQPLNARCFSRYFDHVLNWRRDNNAVFCVYKFSSHASQHTKDYFNAKESQERTSHISNLLELWRMRNCDAFNKVHHFGSTFPASICCQLCDLGKLEAKFLGSRILSSAKHANFRSLFYVLYRTFTILWFVPLVHLVLRALTFLLEPKVPRSCFPYILLKPLWGLPLEAPLVALPNLGIAALLGLKAVLG